MHFSRMMICEAANDELVSELVVCCRIIEASLRDHRRE
jgi:hypothetical protein